MAEVRPIRHETDFRVVPQLYHNDKAAFGQILLGDACAFLARIYTQVLEGNKTSRWAKVKKYKASDFRATKTPFPGGTLVWVDLPLKEDGSHVWAVAYAVVIPEDGEVRLYQVEQSVFGTSCIGSVDPQGDHINHGPLGTHEETVGRILELALGRDPRKAPEPLRPDPAILVPDPVFLVPDPVLPVPEEPEEQETAAEDAGAPEGDLTALCEQIRQLQAAGNWEEADKRLSPLMDRIRSEGLTDGMYLANDLERAMWILEHARPFDRALAAEDYSLPLILRARSLLHGGDRWGAISLLEEAGELAPFSSAVWEAYAETKLHPEDKLDAYRWMLNVCTDTEALTRAYKGMGEAYLELGRPDVAGALLALIGKIGGRAPGLAEKLSGAAPAEDREELLKNCGICVGFSDTVREAARFLEDPRAGEIRDPYVCSALRSIRSLEL